VRGDDWYLEVWCHASDGMRKFALDDIRQAVMSKQTAQGIPLPDIEQQMSEGYGVYAGGLVRVAHLRFNDDAARWVRHEIWHAKQKQTLNDDGSLDLELPYVNDTELVMDVLRHGENVEVLAPLELRQTVARRLKASSTLYD
jgi:predicted DNA-binding transcriptional regulator YafY